MGVDVGVDVDIVNASVEVETTFVNSVAADTASETLVDLGLEVSGLVGSDFWGFFVGKDSTSTLDTISGSGVSVSSVCPLPSHPTTIATSANPKTTMGTYLIPDSIEPVYPSSQIKGMCEKSDYKIRFAKITTTTATSTTRDIILPVLMIKLPQSSRQYLFVRIAVDVNTIPEGFLLSVPTRIGSQS